MSVCVLSCAEGLLLLQEYARKALDFIWEKRQRSSNLVGVTINIHTGDWVRKGGWHSGLESLPTGGCGQENLEALSPTPFPTLLRVVNWVGGVASFQCWRNLFEQGWALL